MSGPPLIHIHYRRLPDREQVFKQHLIWTDPAVKITFATDLTLPEPLIIDGSVALETGSEVIWFTFPGAWHDVGLFHLADGSYTGLYANILTPCTFEPDHRWLTTDLFLDVWKSPAGQLHVLDEDELDEAEEEGWVSAEIAQKARAEVRTIMKQAEAGQWPPPVVSEWSLARARASLTSDV